MDQHEWMIKIEREVGEIKKDVSYLVNVFGNCLGKENSDRISVNRKLIYMVLALVLGIITKGIVG